MPLPHRSPSLCLPSLGRPSRRARVTKRVAAVAAASLAALAFAAPARAITLPEIRSSDANPVPACVTPERLMAFLTSRNSRLDPRFKDIARLYKAVGETWHVRWDYAFYQMAVETNFLTYRTGTGRMGDVDPKQNNFAGIGTTGGGVPGDSFPDVETGVLGQIQHLVVYSGEPIASPVAPRTQLKQDDILKSSRELARPVRFSDLARRWAADPKYGSSIEWVAESYRSEHCRGTTPEPASATEVLPWAKKTSAEPAPRPAARPALTRADATGAGKAAAAKPAAVPSKDAGVETAPMAAPSTPEPQAAADEAPGQLALVSPPALLTKSASPAAATLPEPNPIPASGTAIPATTGSSFDPVANPPSGLGVKPAACRIDAASFGGTKTLLIRSEEGRNVRLVALTVLDGFEKSMSETFIRGQAAGGQSLGEFPSKDAALAKARELCPDPSM